MAVALGEAAVARLTTELWQEGDVVGAPFHAADIALHGVLAAGGTLTVVPLESRAAAANSMVRWTDATTVGDTLTRTAAWVGLRSGLATPLVRHRIGIRVRSTDPAAPALNQHLAAAVGAPEVSLSAAFGSSRPNQKPIVRIHAAGGQTLGFAKVAWNPLTRILVETEAAFLASPSARALRTVRIPGLIHVGSWNDRYIAVTSALSGAPRIRPARPPGVAVLDEVAGLGRVYDAPLATTAYRRRLEERIGTLDGSDAVEAANAASAIDDRWAGAVVRFGHWHGDWVPWNMSTVGNTLIVWDWERTAGDVPVGFDALHYHFHTALAGSTVSPVATLVAAVAAAEPTLAGLGVAPATLPVIATLYALEMHVRFGSTSEPNAGGDVRWLPGLLAGAIRHFGLG